MKQNTMLIGAFVAGLATTYVLQKTKMTVFGAESNGVCDRDGYETNAPAGHTGLTRHITKGAHPEKFENNVMGWEHPYNTSRSTDNHFYRGYPTLEEAKAASFSANPYWSDRTVAPYTFNCCPVCADPEPCPEPEPCPKCIDCSKQSSRPPIDRKPTRGFMGRFFGGRR